MVTAPRHPPDGLTLSSTTGVAGGPPRSPLLGWVKEATQIFFGRFASNCNCRTRYILSLAIYLRTAAVIGGSGSNGKRLASPRAPRISTSSKSSEGATTDAGNPFCTFPNAPSAVPATPFVWFCR